MKFSPILISSLIIKPLRYFFTNYAKDHDLIWTGDPSTSTILIGGENDFNQIPLEKSPRVLVNRGSYQINKTGLTDNMSQAKGVKANLGAMNRTNFVLINGVAEISIEARNEGTCELITDMVSHFILWARPLLCDTQGFKEFGMPMSVSDARPATENIEKFKTVIQIPYIMEENWTVDTDSLKLKGFFLSSI